MTARTPAYLKARFENGDIPIQSDYEDLFDSYINVATSSQQTVVGDVKFNGEIIASRVSASSFTIGTLSVNSVFANNVIATIVSAGNVSTDAIAATSGSITTFNAGTVSANAVNAQTVSAATVNGITLNAISRVTQPVNDGVIAVGESQVSAASIPNFMNVIVTATPTDNGVIVPGPYPGWMQVAINNTAVTANVYPPVGVSIDGLSADIPQVLNPSGRMHIYHITSAQLFTMRGV
jgi:hypothetical protein